MGYSVGAVKTVLRKSVMKLICKTVVMPIIIIIAINFHNIQGTKCTKCTNTDKCNILYTRFGHLGLAISTWQTYGKIKRKCFQLYFSVIFNSDG